MIINLPYKYRIISEGAGYALQKLVKRKSKEKGEYEAWETLCYPGSIESGLKMFSQSHLNSFEGTLKEYTLAIKELTKEIFEVDKECSTCIQKKRNTEEE